MGVFQFDGVDIGLDQNSNGSGWADPGLDGSLSELKADNGNAVALNPEWYVSSSTSSTISPVSPYNGDPNVMTEIVTAIQEAHAQGLTVMLKPMVDCADGTWRGDFAPTDPALWFSQYQAMMVQYAQIAQANHVEMLCIGTEYESLSGPQYTQYWDNIIKAVRAVYSGPITYAATTNEVLPGHAGFLGNLDYIGVDAYYPLTAAVPDPTVAQLNDAWTHYPAAGSYSWPTNGQSIVDFLHSVSTTYGKPIIFPEIGYLSYPETATRVLNDNVAGATPDPQAQANAYESFFETFSHQTSWFKGAFLWQWEPIANPTTGMGNLPIDLSYSPQTKPAEAVMANWFGQSSTTPAPTPTPTPTPPVSANGTIVTGMSGEIVTASHNIFAINGAGEITENGAVMPNTANVTELAYFNNTLYREATSQHLWWSYNETTNSWTQTGRPFPSGAVPPVVTTAADALTVSPGGSVALPIAVSPSAGHHIPSVTITGLTNYESVTDALDGKIFTGSSVTLSAAEVNSGLSLASSYSGAGQPVNTLTVTATEKIDHQTLTSGSQSVVVTDPPARTTGGNTAAGGAGASNEQALAAIGHNAIHSAVPAETLSGDGGHDMFIFRSPADRGATITSHDASAAHDAITDHAISLIRSGSTDAKIMTDAHGSEESLIALHHIVPTTFHAHSDLHWHS
jgi:hypothetical protein